LGNCTTISTNGDCFLPNTTLNHASVAMNMYYASQDRVYEACNFSNSGLITITDPSKLAFHYKFNRLIIYLSETEKCGIACIYFLLIHELIHFVLLCLIWCTGYDSCIFVWFLWWYKIYYSP
jgi:hypothetical protein